MLGREVPQPLATFTFRAKQELLTAKLCGGNTPQRGSPPTDTGNSNTEILQEMNRKVEAGKIFIFQMKL